MSLPDSPLRCYFSLSDPYSVGEAQKSYHDQGYPPNEIARKIDSSLSQNLKAAALLHEQVVFRGTAPFTSVEGAGPHARKLLTGAKDLLVQGALVPEVRAGDEPLAKQLSRQKPPNIDPKEARASHVLAELIDAAPTKHEADATSLSQARSAQLADHLFRQRYLRDSLPYPYLNPDVSHEDLDSLFSILFNPAPVDRSKFFEKCKAMYRNKKQPTLLIQTIYFGLGAISAGANPIFADHLAPSDTLWNYPDLDLASLPLDARKLADKYGIADRLQLPKVSQAVNPERVLNIMGIPSEVLDLLDWKDIMRIRQRTETRSMREKVWKLCRSAENPVASGAAVQAVNSWVSTLVEEVLGEMPRGDMVANFQTILGAAGLVSGLVPAAGAVPGLVMGLLGFSVDAAVRAPFAASKITPLLTYTKLVKDTARRSLKAGKEIKKRK